MVKIFSKGASLGASAGEIVEIDAQGRIYLPASVRA